MDLLRGKLPAEFDSVKTHVRIIIQDDSLGMDYADVYVDPPVVGMRTATASDICVCAAALVHESKHIEIANRSKARHKGYIVAREVAGPIAEVESAKATALALRRLGGPAGMIEYEDHEDGAEWVQRAMLAAGPSNFFLWMTNDADFSRTPLSVARPGLWRMLQGSRNAGRAP
jgi:hypothetical protein